MTRIGAFLRGIGAGAGFMYFFDPDRGKRRRALVRDQMNGHIGRRGRPTPALHSLRPGAYCAGNGKAG